MNIEKRSSSEEFLSVYSPFHMWKIMSEIEHSFKTFLSVTLHTQNLKHPLSMSLHMSTDDSKVT